MGAAADPRHRGCAPGRVSSLLLLLQPAPNRRSADGLFRVGLAWGRRTDLPLRLEDKDVGSAGVQRGLANWTLWTVLGRESARDGSGSSRSESHLCGRLWPNAAQH